MEDSQKAPTAEGTAGRRRNDDRARIERHINETHLHRSDRDGMCGVLAAGCGKTVKPVLRAEPPPPVVAAPPPPPPPPPAAEPEPPPPPVALTEDEIFARKTLEQLNAERPLADVFFDFDRSVIREDGRASLQKNGEWLRNWTSTRITIEGHCDARGTYEYNLSLGDRRAHAAKDYLVSLGVAADRMLAVSKGEESPFCVQENESCWQQNRRGHFIITAK
jgi:peptidoglycan-associated lipoprotein